MKVYCEECGREWEGSSNINQRRCYNCINRETRERIDDMLKADIFVKHIKDHLIGMNLSSVICKICGETIDTIYEEEKG
jgi:hypothetical protein